MEKKGDGTRSFGIALAQILYHSNTNNLGTIGASWLFTSNNIILVFPFLYVVIHGTVERVWKRFCMICELTSNRVSIKKTPEIKSWFRNDIFTVTRDPLTLYSVNRDFYQQNRCKCRDKGSKLKPFKVKTYRALI